MPEIAIERLRTLRLRDPGAVADAAARRMRRPLVGRSRLGGDPSGAADETYAAWQKALAVEGVAGLVVGRRAAVSPGRRRRGGGRRGIGSRRLDRRSGAARDRRCNRTRHDRRRNRRRRAGRDRRGSQAGHERRWPLMSAQLHWPAGSATVAGPWTVALTPQLAGWTWTGLRVAELPAGGSVSLSTGSDEVLVLPLAGSCTVVCEAAAGVEFGADLVGRADVFAGPTDFATHRRRASSPSPAIRAVASRSRRRGHASGCHRDAPRPRTRPSRRAARARVRVSSATSARRTLDAAG